MHTIIRKPILRDLADNDVSETYGRCVWANRVSGLMTARFLLHLRKWDTRRTCLRTTEISKDIDGEQIKHIDFGTSSDMYISTTHSASYVDEFGEDPVYRARTQGPINFSCSGNDI